MHQHKSGILSASVLAAIAGTCAAPGLAQTEPSPAARAGSGALEEVYVTARRREETAQETPVAMTVLSDDLIDRYAIKGIDTIAQLTPGFVTAEASGSVGGTLALRGIGSGDSQPFIDQAVSLNIDGVQISTAQPLRAAQLDLKQIEILRGPQALFFGKNSPGGIISLTSKDPGDELELEGTLGYEFEAEETYVDLMASGPLTDTIGGRIFTRYSEKDGITDVFSPGDVPGFDPWDLDNFPKTDELFLRGTLAFEPNEDLLVRLKGTWADTEIVGGPSHFTDVVHCPYGQPQETPVIPSNCRNDGEIVTTLLPQEFLELYPSLLGNDRHGQRTNEQLLLTAIVDYSFTDSLTLTSVTGYYDVDENIVSNGSYGPGPDPSLGFGVDYTLEQWSQEFRLVSDSDSAINYAVGGLYEYREMYTETFIGMPAFLVAFPIESSNQTHDTYSVFGQVLWDITDQFELTVGGRYTKETKELDDFIVTFIQGDLAGLVGDATKDPAYPDTKLDFDDFSPEVTLAYRPNDDVMYFLSYKEGFKSGGFDAGYTGSAILFNPAQGQEFEPEEVAGFEGGFKSTLADGQLTFNVTAYYYEYDDLQVPTFDTVNTTFRTQNAAEARIQGLELESYYNPAGVPGLSFRFLAAYNDSEFKEYLADCYAGQSQALGCDQVLNPGTGLFTSQDLSGEQLRKAPEWSANLGGYYEFNLGDSLMMSLSTDLAFSDSYIVGTAYQPSTEQSSFTKVDASARLFAADGTWELAVIGRNLTDELNLVNGIDRSFTGGDKGGTSTCTSLQQTNCERLADIIGTPVQGRTVAVELTYRY